MQEFLNIALGFPTIFWTILMGIVTAYWLFVILGALDLELLDIDFDFETDVDLDFETDVDLDFDVDPELDADIDIDGSGSSPLVKVAVALGIGQVPVTILFSFFAFTGWLVSAFGMLYIAPLVKIGAVGVIILGLALVLAVPAMGLFAHPLKPLFRTHTRRAGAEIIGKVCVVTTGSVDESFGQARLDDGGAGLLLHVRCETVNNGLQKHSEALIIGHDKEQGVYFVEPYEQFLASGSDEIEPAGAAVNARAKGGAE